MTSKTDLQSQVWKHAFEAMADLDAIDAPVPLSEVLPESRIAQHLEAILILCAPVAVDASRKGSKRPSGPGMTGYEVALDV